MCVYLRIRYQDLAYDVIFFFCSSFRLVLRFNLLIVRMVYIQNNILKCVVKRHSNPPHFYERKEKMATKKKHREWNEPRIWNEKITGWMKNEPKKRERESDSYATEFIPLFFVCPMCDSGSFTIFFSFCFLWKKKVWGTKMFLVVVIYWWWQVVNKQTNKQKMLQFLYI